MLHGVVLLVFIAGHPKPAELGPFTSGVACEEAIRTTLNGIEGIYRDTHSKGALRMECARQ